MLRPKLGRIWADNSSVARRDPGDTKYLTGWLSEIPTYQVLNFLQWKNDLVIQSLAERGVLEWGGDVTYKKGAAVWDETNNKIYIALLDNPDKTKAPSTNLNQWTGSAIQLSRSAYDATVKKIDDHVADVTGNPHKLTPGRLGTYTVAQIDALVAQYRAEVQTHANRKDNPHKVTATQIGAVPVEGGTYTGDVTMGTGQLFLSADKTRLIKSDSTGVYMKNAAGAIGIDAAGKGFVKTGSEAASEIVTKSTFADNKATVEPNYAIPQPVFYLPLASDLNIYIGGGTTLSTQNGTAIDWNPQIFNGAYFGTNAGNNPQYDSKITYTYKPLEGITDITICVDVYLNNVGSDSLWDLYASAGSATGCGVIQVNKDNTVWFWSEAGSTPTVSVQNNSWHRVVGVRTASSLILYLDGVRVATAAVTNGPITGDAYNFIRGNVQSTANQRYIKVKNFKLWVGALTDNQVSTL
ncbi:putative tail fiber protein [Erwinia phage Mauresque]|nr:putative tail fiber protein [Erwinia phage Mauresque]